MARAELVPGKPDRMMQVLRQYTEPVWIEPVWIERETNHWYRRWLTPQKGVHTARVMPMGQGYYGYSTGQSDLVSGCETPEDAMLRCDWWIWRMYAPAPKESA